MRVFFANGIYFKVASQVNVKAQIELEIWANCSGHRRKKNFSCTFFYEVQISKFWISLLLRVFKIAMLALIAFLAFVQKENNITDFSFLYGMAWPPSACNVMSDIHSDPFSSVFETNRIEGEVFYLSRGIKFPPLIQLSHFQV